MIPKRYLGDSVYAEVEKGMVKLTTVNGLAATNTIYLEPEVMLALRKYWHDLTEAAKARQTEQEPK